MGEIKRSARGQAQKGGREHTNQLDMIYCAIANPTDVMVSVDLRRWAGGDCKLT